MLKLLRSKKAFLLIESMLTVTVLSIGIISVLRAFTVSIHAAGVAQDYMRAGLLLEEKMWDLEMEEGVEEGEDEGDFEGNKKFKWRTKVENIDEDLGLLAAEVGISWKDRGIEKKISTDTYLRAKKEE